MAKSKRLFAGISLPESVGRPIADWSRRVAADWPDAKWMAWEKYHITVCFFGGVAEADVPVLSDALAAAAASSAPLDLRFSRIEFGPPRGRYGTMFWASFEPTPAFAAAVKAVRNAALPFAPSIPEEKAALPHVTLARFRRPAMPGKAGLPQPDMPQPLFRADSLTLFESVAGSGGHEYHVLANYPFGVR